jgi:two-component system, OmpR family, sensor kinase
MKRRGTLSRRLTWALTGLAIFFGSIAVGWGTFTLHNEMNEAMDSAMRETARRLLPLVVDDLYGRDKALEQPRELADAVTESGGRRLVFQVRNADGKVMLHSYGAPAEPLTRDPRPGFSEAGPWRIYTEAALTNTLFVQVAETNAKRNEETLEAASGFLMPLGLLVPVGAFAAWLVLTLSLRPVGRLRTEIASRDSGNLAPIDNADLPAELSAIARSVNRLLGRLRMALESEREFTANAAHELRTPIAGALAQTELLVASLPESADRNRAIQIKQALGGLAQMMEKLLQLARADAGVAITESTADVWPVLRVVIDDYDRSREFGGRVKLGPRPPGGLEFRIDPDAFAIVVRNLLDNALRHGAPGGMVTIEAASPLKLRVANEGPVLAASELRELTARFHRGAAISAGSGLGLAIVSKIMQQTGGKLHLNSPASGRENGFEAIVDFSELAA